MIIFSHLNTFTYFFIRLPVHGIVLGTEVEKKDQTCFLCSRHTHKGGQVQEPGTRETQPGTVRKLGRRVGFQATAAGNGKKGSPQEEKT